MPYMYHMCQGLNSDYFHIIIGGLSNSKGLYTREIRIPTKGGMTIPNIGSLDSGTYQKPWKSYQQLSTQMIPTELVCPS